MLLKHLLFEENDVYLHIDRKSIGLRDQIILQEHLYVLPIEETVAVKWGQISQVDATLKLLQAVMKSGKTYDFVWLISGQDFPLATNLKIFDKLESKKNSAYMEVLSIDTKRYKRLLKRNEVWTAQCSVRKGLCARLLRNFWYMLTGGRYHTFALFRRHYQKDTFYFGSSWWCLPYNAIVSMMQYLADNPRFYRFYSHCHCPDESFFQTLYLNHGTVAENLENILTYIDWEDCKDSPKTFTLKDLDMLNAMKDKGYLLARKFDMNLDADIIYKLSEQLCREARHD